MFLRKKIGKEDQVSVPDVELEVDPNRNITPRRARTPADIPIFLRKYGLVISKKSTVH